MSVRHEVAGILFHVSGEGLDEAKASVQHVIEEKILEITGEPFQE